MNKNKVTWSLLLKGAVILVVLLMIAFVWSYIKANQPCEHDFEEVEAKAPNCTEVGWEAYVKCKKCDYTTYEELPIKHELVLHEAKAPTYTTIGWNEYVSCSKCDYSTYKEIPVIGNNDGEGISKGLDFISNGDGTCYINGMGTCADTDIVIPTHAPSGEVVIAIGAGAFRGCSNITSVVIADSVQHIGKEAFFSCLNMSSVTIGADVRIIDESAFSSCFKIVEVINRSNLKINVGSTYNGYVACYAFEVHNESSKIINEDNYIFYTYNGTNYLLGYKGSDTDLNLPQNFLDQNYEIYNYAFYDCANLKSVVIPESVENIGVYAFYNCGSLQSVTIGNNVESIGASAFNNCTALTSIVVPDSVEGIGEATFGGCRSLKSITLPFIGASASATVSDKSTVFGYIFGTVDYFGGVKTEQFYDSNKCVVYYVPMALETVVINGGEILYGAFYNCSNLKNITVKNQGGVVQSPAFYGETGITGVIIGNGVTDVGDYAFACCIGISSVTIGDRVESIGKYAFANCFGMVNVTIGRGVESIGEYAFVDCHKLVDVVNGSKLNLVSGTTDNGYVAYYAFLVQSDESRIINSDGYLFCYTYLGENYLIGYVGNDTVLTLPVGVTTTIPKGNSVDEVQTYRIKTYKIHDYAFYNNTNLSSVIISDVISEIGAYAFANCTGITDVSIGSDVKLIGECAFEGCAGMTSVTVGDSVEIIEANAFYKCTELSGVHIKDVAAWCGTSFETFESNPVYYAKNLYVNKKLLTQLTVPSNITQIGKYVFSCCENLISVTGGDNLKSIDAYAFYSCTGLASITIGRNVEKIDNNAFQNCYRMAEVRNLSELKIATQFTGTGKEDAPLVIPSVEVHNKNSGLAYMGDYLFYVSRKGDVYLLRYFGDETNLTLPRNYNDSGYHIYKYAFRDCKEITSVSMGFGVIGIGDYAFYNCVGLTSLAVPDSVWVIGESAFGGCSSLESIILPFVGASCYETVASKSTLFGYIFGTSKYDGGERVLQYYADDGRVSYCVPSALKSVVITGGAIFYGAFYNCSKLETVVLRSEVAGIEDWTFYDNTGMSSVVIGNEVISVGENAFSYCKNLVSVVIPESVEYIGRSAFSYCDKLTSVTFNDVDNWYKTENALDWNKKANGNVLDVSDSQKNALDLVGNSMQAYLYKE